MPTSLWTRGYWDQGITYEYRISLKYAFREVWEVCCSVCAKDRDCVCMPSVRPAYMRWGECLWVRFSAIQMIDNSSIFLCFYISFVGFNHKYLLGCVLKWSCRGQCCPIYAHCRPAQVFPASHGYTQSAATYTAYTKSLICQMVSSALQHSVEREMGPRQPGWPSQLLQVRSTQ